MINLESVLSSLPNIIWNVGVGSAIALAVLILMIVLSVCCLKKKAKKRVITVAVILGVIALILLILAILCYTEVINYKAIATSIVNWINKVFYTTSNNAPAEKPLETNDITKDAPRVKRSTMPEMTQQEKDKCFESLREFDRKNDEAGIAIDVVPVCQSTV
ncbi:hypothetical protein NEHOM01_0195 [Nematocida homosporus]|uniref:uncharacterized protein n=1 Tax=Nematocida homosporus TaxID=1912981 RepID=UPI00221F7C4B|nr:uncharacterized protein NEHOM01_0195 [Nematocida homosporus]KAI5184520.1 hypothetical protein NEHOM01_0195 [Nematocida homosporus]